jgi:hypothetical protein
LSSYFADLLFLCVKCYVADIMFQFLSSYFADVLFLCVKCYVANVLFQFLSSYVADVLFLCVKFYVPDMLFHFVGSYIADVLKCQAADIMFHFVSSYIADVLCYLVNSRIVASLFDTTHCFLSCSTPWAAVTLYVALCGFFWWGMMCNLKILLIKVSYFELWLILLLQNKSMSLCNNISHIPPKTEFIVKSARVNLMPWRFERERKKSPTHSLSGRLKRGRAPNGEIKWPFTAAVCSQLHTPIVKMIMVSRVYVVSYKRGSLHLYLRDYWRLEFYAVFC